MNSFEFMCRTRVIFGPGKESLTGREIKREGGHHVMIVYGGGSIEKTGLLGRLRANLSEEGLTYCELGGVKPNPGLERVHEGIRQARMEGADFILAAGGGSVIDTAKAIAVGIPYEGDVWVFFEKRRNRKE